ncbi:MAG TPA: hypothetical protein VFJ96_10785 [Gemmatimonadaceae bacterium]|nr:hypothetical protein [Gemmatimonadaceae bacterium]
MFGGCIESAREVTPIVERQLRDLVERIAPSIERPMVAPVTEDYVIFRITRLEDATGAELPADIVHDVDVVPLLLHEPPSLSPAARHVLLPHRFSYFADDLAIVTWERALIVEPHAEDVDVQYVLEFANAQLLELRVYDAVLDDELPAMYDRIARASRGVALLRPRYSRLLVDLQRLVADTTELVERVENSLKVTDDVYLARIYTAALESFRGRVWRAGIERKLSIIRETYSMLNAASQAARAEALELAIIALIALELLFAIFMRRG